MKFDSLIELVLGGAEKVSPSKPAVLHGETTLTFEDLLSGAQGIAASLLEAGVGRGDRVGIWMEKTPTCVQVLLGILWAGAVYVPLDPKAPWRRCRTILMDCDLSALAVDGQRLQHLHSLLDGLHPRLVLIDGSDTNDKEGESNDSAHTLPPDLPYETLADAMDHPPKEFPNPKPEDLAYILYTSGSTGSPKGVVHTHESGLAFVQWVKTTYGINSGDIFSSHAPFHFDLSISDLYASLGSGAEVRLISSTEAMLPPYLVKKVAEWGITVWYSVPSILSAMLEVGNLEQLGFGKIRILLFAGEVFPTSQLRRLRRALPHVRLSNLFGPTETNVCTYYDVPGDIPESQTAPIPIGRACEHMETFVLDDQGREVKVGVEGTLWARGGNLLHSYWNDPDRTSATLQPDPRGVPGLAYCTGDRVLLRKDGNYDFLGRRDHMVKTRGYRVELGEIESVLTSHPEIVEAVAIPVPDEKIGNRIVVSIVSRSGTSPDPDALKTFCSKHLPSYMIPENVEILDSLPRTSTGKADRQALRTAWERRDFI